MQGYDKIMIFIYGENLVMRYQNMVKKGLKERPNTKYVKDIYVWHDMLIPREKKIDLRRVTYYTSAVGSDSYINQLREEIHNINYKFRGLPYTFHGRTTYQEEWGAVVPKVFKKPSQGLKSRQVDINIVIDMLNHATPSQVDRMLLVELAIT